MLRRRKKSLPKGCPITPTPLRGGKVGVTKMNMKSYDHHPLTWPLPLKRARDLGWSDRRKASCFKKGRSEGRGEFVTEKGGTGMTIETELKIYYRDIRTIQELLGHGDVRTTDGHTT
jgi:hypothetical protein